MIETFKFGGLVFIAYLLGSIPFGLLLSALFSNQDVRRRGSGNIGATNVLRVVGAKLGLLTLFLDVLKGALPVFIALQLINAPENPWTQAYLSLVAMSAFTGHLYPLYLGLQDGGKGVATGWGCFLILSPISALITLLTFILTVCVSKKASLASLSGSAVLSLAIWYTTHSAVFTLCAALMTLLIIYRHKENIIRLIHGDEPSIWGQKR
jgi:glycerol-3-phosphate acyltransferase PlsY